MPRRTASERLAELERRGGQLAGLPVAGPALSPVHVRTVDVMQELLSLADTTSSSDTPALMRTLLGTLKRVRPMLEQQLANVPASVIVEFMGDLREKMDSIIRQATSEETAHDEHDTPAGTR